MSVPPKVDSNKRRSGRLTAHTFFGRAGILSKSHPHYEFRHGQLEMAEAVEAALAEKSHLIVEAGTGVGKTLAYLIPAILSGKRVVISTGTKNLQEQLYSKDVPFLQSLFEAPLRVCYMKGRTNYLCRQKLYDAEREPILSGWRSCEISRRYALGNRKRKPAIAVNSWRSRKTTTPGGSSTREVIPAPAKDANNLKDALLPKCTGGQEKATSSSSIIICFSRTWQCAISRSGPFCLSTRP